MERPAWRTTLGIVLAAGVGIVALVLAVTGQMPYLEAGLFVALAVAYIVG
jgi:hypothetical protein